MVAEEEKRSYSAVFLFLVSLVAICTVWAVWQDVFSRHLWKSYKHAFYSLATDKYLAQIEEEEAALAANPEYVKATADLAEFRRSLIDGDNARRLRTLEQESRGLDTKREEADLDLRIVKGEIEEAWYHLDHARKQGYSGDAERARVDGLLEREKTSKARLAEIDERLEGIRAEIAEIRARGTDLEETLRNFHKKRDLLLQNLDSVSAEWPVVGRTPAIAAIDQVVLKGMDRNNFDNWVDRVDRCMNCHVGIDRAGFEDESPPFSTHPDRAYYLGNHPVRRFGCTPCHGGQGAAIGSVEEAHGKVDYWEDPLLDLDGPVQAKCLTCHRSVKKVAGAEVAARGEWLFEETGCSGCHLLAGDEGLGKIGPSLATIAAKVEPEWLTAWLQRPKDFRPRTQMPDFALPREEAVSISAYLLDASLESSLKWQERSPQPHGVDPADEALVSEGDRLTKTLGCLGCHGFAPGEFASEVAAGTDVAPNLSRIAEKTTTRWMYYWISDPRSYSSEARMPSLRLIAKEAGAIGSYLGGLKTAGRLPVDAQLRGQLADRANVEAGAALIRKYGCYGCHTIPGMESESRVSVELSTFGDKSVDELFFGNRTDIPATWYAWTRNKMLTPRTYATDRIEQNMPDFGFNAADAEALTIFLASRTESRIHPDYLAGTSERDSKVTEGRRLLARYNCAGCHSVDGAEGAIRRYYVADEGAEDAMENAPPVLEGQGTKVESDWLFDFMMKPVRLRPWLEVRMPSFGLRSEEATGIVEFFAVVDGFALGQVILETAQEAGPAEVPVHMGLPEGVFDCYACHVSGTRGPRADQYVVSKKGLSDKEIAEWVSEHLGSASEGAGMSPEQRAEALRNYLGAGGE